MTSPPHTPSPPSGQEEGWFDWAYKGVDHTLPGNGGPECRDFLSLSQRCWESAMASGIGLVALLYAYPRLRLPQACPSAYDNKDRGEPRGKRVLLILMCLTFGIELGFKFSTRQVIWIGNPCHLATMMQIFILAAPPSRIVTAAFRLHMHMLTGAPIAILFPVINTRLLPFETGVYFLQHILMLIIPFYLMKTGDPYIPEDLLDFKWAFTSFGFLYIYHFLPLQFLAYHSQVNLNNMLCPAVSDPFHGKYYRLFAICHQILLIPTLGKVFVIIAKAFNILPANKLPDAPISQVFSTNTNISDCSKQQAVCCCCCSPQRETSLVQTSSAASRKQSSCCQCCSSCYNNDDVDSGISATMGSSRRRKMASFSQPSPLTTPAPSYCSDGAVGDHCSSVQPDQSKTASAMGGKSCGCGVNGSNRSTNKGGSVGTTCGEGDLGAGGFVTRRLVNGKVITNGSGGTSSRRGSGGSVSQGGEDRAMSLSDLDSGLCSNNGHAKVH